MALAITILNTDATQWPRPGIGGKFGKCAVVRFSFVGVTYATNGLSIASETLRALGSPRMVHLISGIGSDADVTTGWCQARLDTVAQKLKLFIRGATVVPAGAADGVEVANATDIAALTIDALVFCDR